MSLRAGIGWIVLGIAVAGCGGGGGSDGGGGSGGVSVGGSGGGSGGVSVGGSGGGGGSGGVSVGGSGGGGGGGSGGVSVGGSGGVSVGGGGGGGSGGAVEWPPFPGAQDCPADGAAELLDAALAAHGVAERAELTIRPEDLAASDYERAGWLDDDFRLSWLVAAREQPLRSGCLSTALVQELEGEGTPTISGAIRAGAARLDRPVGGTPALPAPWEGADAAAQARVRLGLQGSGVSPLDALLDALLPSIAATADARDAMLATHPTKGAAYWTRKGGNLLLGGGQAPSPADPDDRVILLGAARAELYAAAARLAWRLERVGWGSFAGLDLGALDLETPLGAIRVRGPGPDVWPAELGPTLLALDTGGDDTWLAAVAGNASPENAVALAIDLGGDDTWGYAEEPTPYDAPGLLPADAQGRLAPVAGRGAISRSTVPRQGAGWNGVAMLIDLGGGGDHYRTLRGGQGYAHQGVGVLFDDGGDDTYEAELLAQGAAQFGIGLAIDAGEGRDTRRAFGFSQGFGYVGGYGALWDGGGDDAYDCDVGDPAFGGTVLYPSAQLPDRGNSSFCQGAGFGMRGQEQLTHLSGGVGLLRDLGGADSYAASVFAQGTGYWQGVGVLADGGGDDRYDAFWYVQGGAAHYAIGIVTDAGSGADRVNTLRPPLNVTTGGGHDFSVGAFLDGGGSDTYVIPSLALGGSHCNGAGIFVDVGGDDSYAIGADSSAGSGNVGGECLPTRPDARSIGLFLDGGGTDTYSWPEGSLFAAPGNDADFGRRINGLPNEVGVGRDGTGEPGVRP